jgi:hypothetical protein
MFCSLFTYIKLRNTFNQESPEPTGGRNGQESSGCHSSVEKKDLSAHIEVDEVAERLIFLPLVSGQFSKQKQG